MGRVKQQIPPSPPLGKGGAEAPPIEKGGLGGDAIEDGIPATPLTLNDYEPRLKTYARKLRGQQTDAEQRLWQHLRRDQLGVRFLRQRPLGSYIVDFYAPSARLVIELDGSQHANDLRQKEKDTRRDAWLGAQGLKVMRFDDRQVLMETQAVLELIFQVVHESTVGEIPSSMTSPPSPPFARGGATQPTVTEGFPPLQKGGQGGFGNVSDRDEGQN